MKKTMMVVMMLGLAGGAHAFDFGDLAVNPSDIKALVGGINVPAISKGRIEPVGPAVPIKWSFLNGGKFIMGTTDAEQGAEDSKPSHEVSIKDFYMSKTAVTVEQYAECVANGACTEPGRGDSCNWGKTGKQLHPVNCVDWDQANQYAKFIGGGARLPSESEWEYAAKSGGKSQAYPWGDDKPACDKAVMKDGSGFGCGINGTMPVCTKPAGNTQIDGLPADEQLCDMAGNVYQWVQDQYQGTYKVATADGSAYEGTGAGAEVFPYRVLRGGSYGNDTAMHLRADFRAGFLRSGSFGFIGFRLAK
ncbi:MAG: SUMF1/EgtB/PvdO family nonheme iron enzyme [Elusimicrobia bacterium]|nr:SUMF1/EgtB/PvdO family nonheme iron enzyme [Elusimicrobiota bacterium]